MLLEAQLLVSTSSPSAFAEVHWDKPPLLSFPDPHPSPASRPSFPKAVLLEPQGTCKHPSDSCQLFLNSIHDNGKKAGLYKENLLLRGCTIRNTEAVVGIVIYAGRHGRVTCGLWQHWLATLGCVFLDIASCFFFPNYKSSIYPL